LLLAAAMTGALGAASELFAQANEQFIPALVHRSARTHLTECPSRTGMQDYLTLINERDGGINGVKIVFEECETGYATDRASNAMSG
jgi:branched-chain amino acid transport system substrate-binding protein